MPYLVLLSIYLSKRAGLNREQLCFSEETTNENNIFYGNNLYTIVCESHATAIIALRKNTSTSAAKQKSPR